MTDTIQEASDDILFEMELQRISGEKMPDAVIIINEDSLILYANYQAELMFEYTKSEFQNKRLTDLLDDADKIKHSEYVKEFFNDPRPRPMALRGDLPAVAKNGKKLLVNVFLDGAPTTRGNIGIAYIRRKLDSKKV